MELEPIEVFINFFGWAEGFNPPFYIFRFFFWLGEGFKTFILNFVDFFVVKGQRYNKVAGTTLPLTQSDL